MSNKFNGYIEHPTASISIAPKTQIQIIDVFDKGSFSTTAYENVSSSATMDSYLTDNTNTGKMYQFTGTSDTNYDNGSLYICGVAIPTVTADLTYTGEPQSPTIVGYDSTQMTQTGIIEATLAGDYTVTYTLNSGLIWEDGTAAPKSFIWTIKKWAGTLSVSPASVYFTLGSLTATITVTSNCLGTIVVSGLDDITYSVSGNIVTLIWDGQRMIEDPESLTVSVIPDSMHRAPTDVYIAVTTSTHVIDLTNTTWRFNNDMEYTSAGIAYSINYTTDSTINLTTLYAPFYLVSTAWYIPAYGKYTSGDTTYHQAYIKNSYSSWDKGWVEFAVGKWTSTATSKPNRNTIIITGGTDVTNSTLIEWLYENATKL